MQIKGLLESDYPILFSGIHHDQIQHLSNKTLCCNFGGIRWLWIISWLDYAAYVLVIYLEATSVFVRLHIHSDVNELIQRNRKKRLSLVKSAL